MKWLALKVMRSISFDFKIKHHWVKNRKITVHSFQHKNYWWHGRNREHDDMVSIQNILKNGDTVLEVGAHIGYLSILFRDSVGKDGQVHIFEPGPNNLKYLRKNVSGYENVYVSDEAMSDHEGYSTFYVEDLSGQNNTLLEDMSLLEKNESSFKIEAHRSAIKVKLNTIDSYVEKANINPNFIKIDVEGAETLVVNGMKKVAEENKPLVMIEVTSDFDEINDFFISRGYDLFDASLQKISGASPELLNIFCIHKTDPRGDSLR